MVEEHLIHTSEGVLQSKDPFAVGNRVKKVKGDFKGLAGVVIDRSECPRRSGNHYKHVLLDEVCARKTGTKCWHIGSWREGWEQDEV